MPKVLYLGTDPAHFVCEGEVVHYPVIKLEPVGGACVQEALERYAEFTHLIFTSKNGVRFFYELFAGRSLDGKRIISVGPVTTEALGREGVLEANEASQEGVIALLEREDLCGASLLLPTSKRARPHLREYLKQRGVPFFYCPLYEPVPVLKGPRPQLRAFDAIVFTSPSTVWAFFSLFKTLPDGVVCVAQGEVTQKAIQKLYKKGAGSILILNLETGGRHEAVSTPRSTLRLW